MGNRYMPEEEDLKELVRAIRKNAKRKDQLRKDLMEWVPKAVLSRYYWLKESHEPYERAVPISFWSNKHNELAETIADIMIWHVEKGDFDFEDEEGNPLLKEDGSLKIRYLPAVMQRKIQFIFDDLIDARVDEYLILYNRDIPAQKAQIKFLEDLARSRDDPTLERKIRKSKKVLKKIEKAKMRATQLYAYIKNNTEQKMTAAAEIGIFSSVDDVTKDNIMECLKRLTPIQRQFLTLSMFGFETTRIADFHSCTVSNASQHLNKVNKSLLSCLDEMGRKQSIAEMPGGSHGL